MVFKRNVLQSLSSKIDTYAEVQKQKESEKGIKKYVYTYIINKKDLLIKICKTRFIYLNEKDPRLSCNKIK